MGKNSIKQEENKNKKQRMFVHSLEFDSCFLIVGKMSYLITGTGGGQPWVPHWNSTHAEVEKTGD